MDNFDHVLVFKTNITSEADQLKLSVILAGQHTVEKWNIDFMDEDCVLRIVSAQLKHHQVITLMNHHGYECCILE